MSTDGQEPPPVPKRREDRKPGYLILRPHQLDIPIACRSSPEYETCASPFQKLVLIALARLTWEGTKACFATDLEIADAMKLKGSVKARERRMQRALNRWTYRKRDPKTGAFYGDLVILPTLCDLGYVEIVHHPHGKRQVILTPKWLHENGTPRPAVQGSSKSAPQESVVAPTLRVEPAVIELAGAAPVEPAVVELVEPTVVLAPVETQAAPPTPEQLKAVLGEPYVNAGRRSQAEKLRTVLSNQGVRLVIEDGGLVPKPQPNLDLEEVIQGNTEAVYEGLKPDLLDLLKSELKPSTTPPPLPPDAGEVPARKKFAPPVVNPTEILAMANALTAHPATDDSDCQRFARRLVTNPGFKPTEADAAWSEKTYFGIALATKEGKLPQVVLNEALEAAFRPNVENRGAMLIGVVKRQNAALRKPDKGVSP